MKALLEKIKAFFSGWVNSLMRNKKDMYLSVTSKSGVLDLTPLSFKKRENIKVSPRRKKRGLKSKDF
ncbi:MAG: hypothetical protein JW976_02250 [Syntrophaceae bacterium]|nr:hypothetical protein [Syntrophaceae bacterium]